jgi:hypothetical protein
MRTRRRSKARIYTTHLCLCSDNLPSHKVTGQRRSARSNLGSGGRLTQFTNIERAQTTTAPRKKVNPVLQSQPVNVLAPQAAKNSSKLKSRTVEVAATVESRFEVIPAINPTRYLAKTGERYGFILPTESEQCERASDRPQVSGNDDEHRPGEKDDGGVRSDDDDDDEGDEGTRPDEDDYDEARDTRTYGQGAEQNDEDDEENDKGNEYDDPFGSPAMDIDDGNRRKFTCSLLLCLPASS